MSKYTTELRYIIESGFDIGLKDYPIFNENHRKELNNKIINHFYMREIGAETPQLFKIWLNRKMNEIMPYYNQLYESETVDFNPLNNIDITETFEHDVSENIDNKGKNSTSETQENTSSSTQDNEGTQTNKAETTDKSTNTSTSEDKRTIVNCDTPQSRISQDDIDNNTYVSSYQRDKTVSSSSNTSNNIVNTDNSQKIKNSIETNLESTSENTSNSNVEGNTKRENKETYTRKTEGSSAGLPFSKAIAQWREIMLNIDMMIIEELEPLFIQLW